MKKNKSRLDNLDNLARFNLRRALRSLWSKVFGSLLPSSRRRAGAARPQDFAWEAQERDSNPYLRVDSPDTADVLVALDPPHGVDLRADNALLRRRIDFWMRMAAESEAQSVLLVKERDEVLAGGDIPVTNRPGGRIRRLG